MTQVDGSVAGGTKQQPPELGPMGSGNQEESNVLEGVQDLGMEAGSENLFNWK